MNGVLLEPGGWVAYEISTTAGSRHDVRLVASSVGDLALWVDGVRVAVMANRGTGNWTGQGIRLGAGGHKIRIAAETASLALRALIVRRHGRMLRINRRLVVFVACR